MALKLSSTKSLLLFFGLSTAFSIPRSAEGDLEGSTGPPPGAYSFPIVRETVKKSLNDLWAREDAYIAHKYGLEHRNLAARAGPGGSATAVPIRDNAEYYIYLKIEGKSVQVLPDTGSSKFWVPSSAVAGNKPAPYSWKPSNTATGSCNDQSSWSIRYADGNEFSGPVCNASVSFPSNDISVANGNIPVLLATKAPNNKQERGILGLAHDQYTGVTVASKSQNIPTFFRSIIPNLPQPLFTMDYKLKKNGSIDFGYIDASKYTGSINYAPRRAGGNWDILAKAWFVPGTKTGNLTQQIPFGIDSGVQRIFLPQDIVTKYHSNIPGAVASGGGWDYPCTQTPPDISFYINGSFRTVPGRYILYGPNPAKSGYCTSSIANSPFANEGALFGMPWLRTQFVVFLNSSSTYPDGAVGLANKVLN